MAIQVAFVRFPGGFRVDRIEQERGSDYAIFDILCEQPEGTFASAVMESADVLSADDIAYYMALADQQARRDT